MEGEKPEFLIVYYINEIKRKPEQRCSGLFVCRKINAPYKGAESISPAARILGGEWECPDEPSGEYLKYRAGS